MRSLIPIVERFWSKVDQQSSAKCWNWTGGISAPGYGMLGKGRRGEGVMSAHRFSFELHNGRLPRGKIVMHKCNNPACVNPKHLMAGTYGQNNKQAYDDGLKIPHRGPNKRTLGK